MASSVALREFHFPHDYAAVIRFWESIEEGIRVGVSDTPDEIQRKMQRDPDLFLLAKSDNEIIGTVIGGFDGRRGMIYHMAVAASWREREIDDRLMSEVEARLRVKGCLKCYLVVLRDNKNALIFYEHLGWKLMDQDLLYAKEFV